MILDLFGGVIRSSVPKDSPLRDRLLAGGGPELAGLGDPVRARWLLAAAAAGTLDLTGATAAERDVLARQDPAARARAARDLIVARYPAAAHVQR